MINYVSNNNTNIKDNACYQLLHFRDVDVNENPEIDKLVISFNVIKAYPSNCLVRDDKGEMKIFDWGGVTRNRISPQSDLFGQRKFRKEQGFNNDIKEICFRTKDIPQLLSKAADHAGLSKEQKAEFVDGVVKTFANDTMAFCSLNRLYALADFYKETGDVKRLLKETKSKFYITEEARNFVESKARLPLDIALTGRMSAMDSHFTVTGALSVATGYSTHAASIVEDMFACVDDLPQEGSTASGHLGFKYEAPYVVYHFYLLDLGQLKRNRGGGSVVEDVEKTLITLYSSCPVGKQGKNLANVPWNFADISIHNRGQSVQANFEKPVKASPEGGFLSPSIAELKRQLAARREQSESLLNEYLSVTVGSGEGCVSLKKAAQQICGYIHKLEQAEVRKNA